MVAHTDIIVHPPPSLIGDKWLKEARDADFEPEHMARVLFGRCPPSDICLNR